MQTPVGHCLQGTVGNGKQMRNLTPPQGHQPLLTPQIRAASPDPVGGTDSPTLWKVLPHHPLATWGYAGFSPTALSQTEPAGARGGVEIARADHALALAFRKRAPGRAKTVAKCPPGPGSQQGTAQHTWVKAGDPRTLGNRSV